VTQEVHQDSSDKFYLLPRITRISWHDLFSSLVPVVIVSIIAIIIALHFLQPAPPSTISISSGPEGSVYRSFAEKYRTILARNGIKLEILPSEGSLDNLKHLTGSDGHVDIGFVQGGVATGSDISNVVSLGSVFYEPLAIVYKSNKPIQRLSELNGKRVAIGPDGSGTRLLALALLKANEIQPGGPTKLVDLAGEAAVDALNKNQIDAAF